MSRRTIQMNKLKNYSAYIFVLLFLVITQCLKAEAQSSISSQLGFTVKLDSKGKAVVDQVAQDSPISNLGVTSGIVLTSINGLNICGRSLSSIRQKLRGVQGSYVDLTFHSPERGDFTERLKRQNYSISSLEKKSSSVKSFNQKTNSTNTSRPIISKIPQKKNSAVPPHWISPTKWIHYSNQSQTFSTKIPDGWEVSSGSKSGKIQIYSHDNESLTILPFFLPGKHIQTQEARGLFNALAKNIATKHSLSTPKLLGNSSIKAVYKDSSLKEVVSMIWRNTQAGTVGRFFVAESPSGYSKHYNLVFSKILSSLKFSPKPNSSNRNSSLSQQSAKFQSPNSIPVEWKTFVDPKQGAFTVEVPAGWNVSGGMEQPMAVDTRGWVRAVSPDQNVVVFIGDARVPSFTLPTAQLSSLGFPPGSNYSPGYGFNTIVSYYLPANKFVPQYGIRVLKKLSANNIRVLQVENQPNLAQVWNADKGAPIYSAASCKISCNAGNTPMSAFFIGSTRKSPPLWYMTLMTGIYCTTDREPEAMQVYSHMYKTFKMNPNWQQGQLKLTQRFSKMMFQSWRDINQIMRSSWDYRNAIQDRTHRKVVNSLRGTQDMVDPSTGVTYNVESGPNYHWINNDGYTVLGTNQYGYPGANWTELINVP